MLCDNGQATELRTSWVMAPVRRNCDLITLRLHRERDQLGVVADQVGCPSSTLNLANACWRLISSKAEQPPLLHWCDAGAASWYDVSVAVGELAAELELIETPAYVMPIRTEDYPTPAQRPAYSLLDCSSTREQLELDGEHWRQALRAVLRAVPPS